MEQFGLHLDSDFANLVEKQGAAIRLFKLAGPVVDSSGESTLAVTEQLALKQVCGKCRAVHFQESLAETP